MRVARYLDVHWEVHVQLRAATTPASATPAPAPATAPASAPASTRRLQIVVARHTVHDSTQRPCRRAVARASRSDAGVSVFQHRDEIA